MAHLSITIPDALAKASQKVAHTLGISRAQFIREAIVHEVAELELKFEIEAMANSFISMKKSRAYLGESDLLMDNFNIELPPEEAF